MAASLFADPASAQFRNNGIKVPAVGWMSMWSSDLVQQFYDNEWKASDQATIGTTHTFLTGKGFVEMYTTIGESELMAKKIGARDSKGFLIEFDFFFPGKDDTAAQMFGEEKEFIYLIRHFDCGTPTVWQMGGKCLSARLEEGEWKSGKALAADSRMGWVGKLQAYMSYLTTYSGTITLYP